MSDGLSLGGVNGLSGQAANPSDLSAWAERLAVAQSARQEQAVNQAAASLRKAEGNGPDPKEMARLRKVSQDFESVFLAYMMKTGRESVPKGGLLGQTQGEQIFTEMRDDELAKHMAQAGGIGLSKLLVDQLTRVLQEQQRRLHPSPGQD